MRAPWVLVGLAAVVVASPTAASAMWSSAGVGPAAVSADTMTNAAGLTATCANTRVRSPVDLAWTISPDAYVDGYEIVRTDTTTGVAVVLPVAGRATASYVDAPPGTNKVPPVGYAYTIRATSSTTSWSTPVLAAVGVPTYSKSLCTTA